jgi:hypothetical protein
MSAIQNKRRDLQPETVKVAKRQAERLTEIFAERGVVLKRSDALEAVARLHGARDWNTFRAGLAPDEGISEPKPAPSEGELRRFLALDTSDPALCARRLITIAGPGPDHDGMWGSREAGLLEAILHVLFRRAGSERRGPSLKELRAAMTMQGTLDLYDWCEREISKTGMLRALHIRLSSVPGFDFRALRLSRIFDPRTREQYGFTCDVWAKLIDDLSRGDVPIPAALDTASDFV